MTARDQTIETMAQAILAVVPFGYGMTKPEAAGYAKAALAALEKDFVIMPRVLTHETVLIANEALMSTSLDSNPFSAPVAMYAALIAHVESKPPENG